jgi:NAD(P)-dependent dehydrogenase (short-subunit alcohol dehydrogenase family)
VNVKQLFNLTGRVAIVSGGSMGLGLQMVEGLAEMGRISRSARAKRSAARKQRKAAMA